MEQYLDQRIINTKQDLYSALFDLLKSSTTIKVLDICKKANITPMTFYHHYGDKTQLIQDAINDQLSLRLPIPIKLRPNNLKQTVYYLINFLCDFASANNNLLVSVIKNVVYKQLKNTYLDLLIKTINYYFNNELKRMFSYEQPITINIWSDFLTFGFIGLIFKRLILNKSIQFEIIKNNFNLFINKYLIIN